MAAYYSDISSDDETTQPSAPAQKNDSRQTLVELMAAVTKHNLKAEVLAEQEKQELRRKLEEEVKFKADLFYEELEKRRKETMDGERKRRVENDRKGEEGKKVKLEDGAKRLLTNEVKSAKLCLDEKPAIPPDGMKKEVGTSHRSGQEEKDKEKKNKERKTRNIRINTDITFPSYAFVQFFPK